MKHKTKYYFAVFLTAVLLFFTRQTNIFASEVYTSGDYQYTEKDNLLTITLYSGTESEVWIPAYINNKKVSVIGKGSFSGNTNVKKVHLPYSVRTVEEGAFSETQPGDWYKPDTTVNPTTAQTEKQTEKPTEIATKPSVENHTTEPTVSTTEVLLEDSVEEVVDIIENNETIPALWEENVIQEELSTDQAEETKSIISETQSTKANVQPSKEKVSTTAVFKGTTKKQDSTQQDSNKKDKSSDTTAKTIVIVLGVATVIICLSGLFKKIRNSKR